MTSLELYQTLPARLDAAKAAKAEVERAWPAWMPVEGPRRWLNVTVALAAIVLTLPLMVLIGVLIKLTSPGPILYRQPRVGRDRRCRGERDGNHRRSIDCGGKPFTIYKFRTMRVSGGNPNREVWASPDDPRVTRIGRILRQYRLDELPQLFNVLKGDMNIVGPRPEQPGIFHRLMSEIPGYRHRQLVRPGITGWAQVNHHYDASIEDVKRKVGYDLEYVTRQSVLQDLKIMLMTAPTVVFKRGAW
jgi:lipopolysaccharide/colanic/teichoic acid biosynthesis glycosyltransferase